MYGNYIVFHENKRLSFAHVNVIFTKSAMFNRHVHAIIKVKLNEREKNAGCMHVVLNHKPSLFSIATVTIKTLSEHQLFTLKFAFKLFHVSITITNYRSPKYYL